MGINYINGKELMLFQALSQFLVRQATLEFTVTTEQ